MSTEHNGAPHAYAELERRVGVEFRDKSLLRTALTHSSFANEHPDDPTGTNERLEFLGDAVLGMVAGELLFKRFPGEAEGRLTAWRAQLVCGPTLSRAAREELDLGNWLRLGRGEEATGGRDRETNLERAFEAIIGAIFLDQGLDDVRAFVARTLRVEIEAIDTDEDELDPKGALQQRVQASNLRPDYRVIEQEGPEHDRTYTVEVRVAGEGLATGDGSSKQQAEKEAARRALAVLKAREAEDERS